MVHKTYVMQGISVFGLALVLALLWAQVTHNRAQAVLLLAGIAYAFLTAVLYVAWWRPSLEQRQWAIGTSLSAAVFVVAVMVGLLHH